LAIAVALAASAALAAGCYDPVHLDAVATLGPETPGITPGPSHRAGQPCSTCHGGEGPAESELSIGGTLYRVRGETEPLGGGEVVVTDARGESRRLQSNEAGNFFVRKAEWSPVFPLRVAIEAEGVRREMVSTIGRDGGCASCHRDTGDRSFIPGVFLRDK
jgi:hypothetical protein